MKNKIIILIAMLLTGCGYAPMKNSFVIIKIEESYNGLCAYHGIGAYNVIGNTHSKFYDTCGKFQIGDTINFVKK